MSTQLYSLSLEHDHTKDLVLPPALVGGAGLGAILELMLGLKPSYLEHAIETVNKYGVYEVIGQEVGGYRIRARIMRVDIPDDGREK